MKIPTNAEIDEFIRNLPVIKSFLAWSKKHSLPGFSNVPLYDVCFFIVQEAKQESLVTRANSIAFNFFLSIFPILMALFTLIPYILPFLLNDKLISFLPDGNFDFNETLTIQIREFLPETLENQLISFIKDVTTTPRFGLLSFGFFLAIFFASNGMLTLMRGFEKSHQDVFIRRSVIHKRLLAINLTALIGFLLIASVLLIILGNSILGFFLNYIESDSFTSILLYSLRWIIISFILYTGVSLIYRYGAPTRKRFRFFSPGASIATILTILSSIIFAFYIDNFGMYNKLYGTIGSIIVLMLWIQINAFILLVGFELNASIAVNKNLRATRKPE